MNILDKLKCFENIKPEKLSKKAINELNKELNKIQEEQKKIKKSLVVPWWKLKIPFDI